MVEKNLLQLAADLISMAIPTTVNTLYFWTLGVILSREIFKPLDYNLKETDAFKNLSRLEQEVYSRILDGIHHWWIGAFLMLYPPAQFTEVIRWVGAGIFIADMPDFYNRIRDTWNTIQEYLNSDE